MRFTKLMHVVMQSLHNYSTLWVSKQPYCTRTVSCGCPSSPALQGQYPMGIQATLLYKDSILWVSQQSKRISNDQQPYCTMTVFCGFPAALLYKDSIVWVSKQPYCTRAVSYGYHSSPIVQGQYPVGVPAALLYKDNILWVSQQPDCTRTEPYVYPSSPAVQGQYPMGIPAALLYKDYTI